MARVPALAHALSAALMMCLLQAVLGCKDALALHNQYRAKHRAPALRWDSRAASRAQSWANTLASRNCRLAHSPWGYRAPCGENIYAGWGDVDGACRAATEMWYAEKSSYKFSSRPWSTNKGRFSQIGHFSQLVWRSTYGLGCGVATRNGCVVVVCHYAEAGNMVSDEAFLENVRSGGGGRRLLAERAES